MILRVANLGYVCGLLRTARRDLATCAVCSVLGACPMASRRPSRGGGAPWGAPYYDRSGLGTRTCRGVLTPKRAVRTVTTMDLRNAPVFATQSIFGTSTSRQGVLCRDGIDRAIHLGDDLEGVSEKLSHGESIASALQAEFVSAAQLVVTVAMYVLAISPHSKA